MSVQSSRRLKSLAGRQSGQAALLTVLLLSVGAIAIVYNFVAPAKQAIEREELTADALAQAKVALIGYALSVNVAVACAGSNCPRIGDLPCPDLDNDGQAEGSCGSADGSIGQNQRLGRLPWKTLGLPDLRDGYGERLWYAVSNNFKNNVRADCAAPGTATCRNSDIRGTITVRNGPGTVINDGTNPDAFTPSGIIAVIIAPGAILKRQGAATGQIRSTAVENDPLNYLDVGNGEDNANFVDSTLNGFINGTVVDGNGDVIVNDRILAITYRDLLPPIQRRVAKEVLNCLNGYASVPQNSGRYPWAAPITDVTPPYGDQVDVRYGRVPDTLNATQLGVLGGVADLVCLIPALCMTPNWPASCSLTQGSWWNNWKEMVFYGVADAYKPADPISALLGVAGSGGCGSCLTVNPSPGADKRVVVLVAGNRLAAVAGGQPRTTAANKSVASNYFEGENDNPPPPTPNIYEQQPTSATFNDFVLFR